MTTPSREFDLNPHPRILPMLGEINLPQWRCIAELVDNAVDAFLTAARSGHPIHTPEVHVSLPTADDPSAKVTIRDTGPGMDLGTLENAVKAGWTGNDPINNLGMFGMGFNIATARLGTVTRVWTTRQEDTEWCGLEINFETLVRQRHFKTPMLTRPKTDSPEHGTEITIEKLKPEQRQWLSRIANRSKIQKELGRAYSTMLRPNGRPVSFALKVNGNLVPGRHHCIWGGEAVAREVETTRYGVVSAYQLFDRRLPDRLFCQKCWQWLAAGEELCPACETKDGVVPRQRRVHGWLGIQRYLDENHYGIDLIRHGRK
ncbi:MAG: ATP-binding protein, partial [Verrucomicrobiota bacterium]